MLLGVAVPVEHRLFLLGSGHRRPAGEVGVAGLDLLADDLGEFGLGDGLLAGGGGDGAIRVEEVAEVAEGGGGGGGRHMRELLGASMKVRTNRLPSTS